MSDRVERGTSERPSEQPRAMSDTPVLRIVNPDATPEEIAALVAVFSALGSAPAAPAAPRPAPEWSRPARRVRMPLAHGPGGWRASSLPR